MLASPPAALQSCGTSSVPPTRYRVTFPGPVGPISHDLEATDPGAAHSEVHARFPSTLALCLHPYRLELV
jgi:hypothetical protein